MANNVKLEITVDDKGAVQALKNVTGQLEKTGKAAKEQSSLVADLEKNWVALAAGATAVYAAVVPQIQAYMASERATMNLGIAMKNQGTYTRQSLSDMEDFASQIQKTTTVEDDLAKSVMATFTAFGMTAEQIKNSTKIAADVAAFTGDSIESVADKLGKAYIGKTRALQEYGIVLDESVPKSKIFTEAMEQLNQKFGGSAAAELETYAGQWKQLKNVFGDVQEFLGLVFLKTIQGVLFAFSELGKLVNSVFAGILDGLAWLTGGLEKLSRVAGFERLAEGLGGVKNAIAGMAATSKEAVKVSDEFSNKMAVSMRATDGVTTALDKMGNAGKNTKPVIEDLGKATVKSAKESQKAIENEGLAWEKIIGKMQIAEAEAIAEIAAEDKKAREDKLASDVAAFELGMKYEDEATAYAKEAAKEKADAYRTLYKDIGETTRESFDFKVSLLNEEYRKYTDLLGDNELLSRAYAERYKELERDKLLASGTLFDGIKVGYRDMLDNQKTWAQAGLAIFEGFTTASQSMFSSLFSDILTGDLQSFDAYFKSFCDSLVQTFASTVAQMAAEKLASTVSDVLGSAALGLIDLFTKSHEGEYDVTSRGLNARQEAASLKANEHLRVLFEGEMVLPADVADDVRAGKMDSLRLWLGRRVSPFGDSSSDVFSGDLRSSKLSALGRVVGMSRWDSISDVDLLLNRIAFQDLSAGLPRGYGGGDYGSMGETPIPTYGIGVSPEVMDNFKDRLEGVGIKGFATNVTNLVTGGPLGIGGSILGVIAAGWKVLGDALMSNWGFDITNPYSDWASNLLGAVGGSLGGIPLAVLGCLAGNMAGTAAWALDKAFGWTLGGRIEGQWERAFNANGYQNGVPDEEMFCEGGTGLFGDGGIARGPLTGYAATLHGDEAVIPLPNGRSIPVEMGGGDLISEIRRLREEIKAAAYAIAKNTGLSAKIFYRWDNDGIPAERTV